MVAMRPCEAPAARDRVKVGRSRCGAGALQDHMETPGEVGFTICAVLISDAELSNI